MATPIATPHAHAVVDLDAVAHNTRIFAGHTTAAVMAVVRADVLVDTALATPPGRRGGSDSGA